MKAVIKTTDGTSHLAYTLDMGGLGSNQEYTLDEVIFHIATVATAANTFAVRKRSHYGAAYDAAIVNVPTNGVMDIHWTDGPIRLNGKDRISFAWTNDAASFKQWGLEIHLNA